MWRLTTLTLSFNCADLVGRARTGCGKTLAFVLPVVERLLKEQQEGKGTMGKFGRLPSTIVMAPTRELAKQVSSPGSLLGLTATRVMC